MRVAGLFLIIAFNAYGSCASDVLDRTHAEAREATSRMITQLENDPSQLDALGPEILERLSPLLTRYFAARGFDESQVEDLVQATLLDYWRFLKRGEFRTTGKGVALPYEMARRSISYGRGWISGGTPREAVSPKPNHDWSDAIDGLSEEDQRILSHLRTGYTVTDVALATGIAPQEIEKAVQRLAGLKSEETRPLVNLSPFQEAVLRLRSQGWTATPIAERLKSTPGSIGQSVNLVRQRVRDALGRSDQRFEKIDFLIDPATDSVFALTSDHKRVDFIVDRANSKQVLQRVDIPRGRREKIPCQPAQPTPSHDTLSLNLFHLRVAELLATETSNVVIAKRVGADPGTIRRARGYYVKKAAELLGTSVTSIRFEYRMLPTASTQLIAETPEGERRLRLIHSGEARAPRDPKLERALYLFTPQRRNLVKSWLYEGLSEEALSAKYRMQPSSVRDCIARVQKQLASQWWALTREDFESLLQQPEAKVIASAARLFFDRSQTSGMIAKKLGISHKLAGWRISEFRRLVERRTGVRPIVSVNLIVIEPENPQGAEVLQLK